MPASNEICDAVSFFQKLKEDQEAFENAIMIRIESASESNSPSLKALAKPVRDDINDILSFFNSCERLHPDQYSKMVTKINAMLTEVTAQVRARMKKGEKEQNAIPETVS